MRFSWRFSFLSWMAVGLFPLVLIGLYYNFLAYTPDDFPEYEKLTREANPRPIDLTQSSFTTTQEHHQMHKEIRYFRERHPLLARIHSVDAQLVLEHKDHNIEVSERMNDITAFMQEELFYLQPDGREIAQLSDASWIDRNSKKPLEITPDLTKPMQLVRYIKAHNGTYFYQQDSFLGENVEIMQFVAPGHALIDSVAELQPIMKGRAKTVEFTLIDNDLCFHADGVTLEIDQGKEKSS